MKMRKPMELLAPAGNMEALRAAVCAGADAVYMGYSAFNARASAANFDGEAFAKAVAYAHLHHVRVYAAVNTLVKEQELEAVYGALKALALARADAVIVQDMGVAALARQHFPTLALHASTQMAIHNATGVRWAGEQGFQRVVLARECSLADMQEATATGVEVEVFVHGALCASVSGQCLMSSMAGGRSGNRGRCAQPCRQQFTMGESRGALLSTRDLCLRDTLPALASAGVRALKIEGRLKSPEYVAVVTDSYRRALDAMDKGCFVPGDAGERNALLQVFHRGGFTLGHALGAEDSALVDPTRVSHQGLPMGQVTCVKNGLATLRLTRELWDGDGLQLQGERDVDIRYSGKDQKAGEDAILRLRPGDVSRPGDPVRRLADSRQLAWARQSMEEKPIPVRMKALFEAGKPMELCMKDGSVSITVRGEAVAQAQTRPTTGEEARRQLARLGESPFVCAKEDDLQVEMGEGLFVPVSMLNSLRRQAVEALIQARCAAFFGTEKEQRVQAFQAEVDARQDAAMQSLGEWRGNGQTGEQANEDSEENEKVRQALLRGPVVSFIDAQMGQALLQAGAALLLYAPPSLEREKLAAAFSALPQGTWLELPPQLGEEDLEIVRVLVKEHTHRLGGVVLGSVGQLGAAFPVSVALGSGIPVTNHLAAEALLAVKPAFFILWPEWSHGDLRHMLPQTIPALLTGYGRERLMLLNHCPLRVARGLGEGRVHCNLCQRAATDGEDGHAAFYLTDRKGYRFPLVPIRLARGCVSCVLNALPTDLRKHEDKRRALGAGMLLRFTLESPQEQIALVESYTVLLRGEGLVNKPLNPLAGLATAGHLMRGVE